MKNLKPNKQLLAGLCCFSIMVFLISIPNQVFALTLDGISKVDGLLADNSYEPRFKEMFEDSPPTNNDYKSRIEVMFNDEDENKNNTYSNTTYHYTFVVPEQLHEISKLKIDELNNLNTVGQIIKPDNFIDFDTGFYFKNSEYPYILVQHYEVNTPSYAELSKLFSNIKNNANEIKDKTSSIKDAVIDDPYIDQDRHIVFIKAKIDTEFGEGINLLAVVLGKEIITQFTFYATADTYQDNVDIFKQLINSFKYDSGYEYDEQQAKQSNSASIIDRFVAEAMAILGMGLIFGLFSGLFLLSKKVSRYITQRKRQKIKNQIKIQDNLDKPIKRFFLKTNWLKIILILIVIIMATIWLLSQRYYFMASKSGLYTRRCDRLTGQCEIIKNKPPH